MVKKKGLRFREIQRIFSREYKFRIYLKIIKGKNSESSIRFSDVVIKPLRNNIAINAIKSLTFSILFIRRDLIS